MAITLDQKSPLGSIINSGTFSTTFTTNPTAGSKLIVVFTAFTTPSPTVTDNASPSSNTYTKDSSVEDSAAQGFFVYIFYADNIALPSSGFLKVTVGGSPSFGSMCAASFLGAAAGGSEAHGGADVPAGGGWTTATSPSVGSTAGDLYIGGISNNTGQNPEAMTTSSPGVTLQQQTDGVNNIAACLSYLIGGAAPSSITWGDSDGGAASGSLLIAAFKPVATPTAIFGLPFGSLGESQMNQLLGY